MPGVDPGRTVAGGMQAAAPGEVTFGAARRFVDKIDLVNDTEIEDAIFGPLSLSNVLAEPAGAPPLAAMKGPLRGEPGDKVGLGHRRERCRGPSPVHPHAKAEVNSPTSRAPRYGFDSRSSLKVLDLTSP